MVVLGEKAPAPGMIGIPLLVVLMCKLMGLYDRDENLLRKTTLEEVPSLFQVATSCALLLWIGGGFLVVTRANPDNVVTLWLSLVALLVIGRAAARYLVGRSASPERCLVIGDSRSAELLRESLDGSDQVNATLVGRISMEVRQDRSGALSSTPQLLDHLHGDIDRVILAPGHADSDAILDTVRVAKAAGAKVSVLPRLLEVVGTSSAFDDVNGMLLFGLGRRSVSNSSRALKRSVDAVLAAVVLALVSPLLGVLALASAMSSGPVLDRRRRIGADSRPFNMLSFHTSAPASLNQLPQLVNVLRGDMSLVGPPPLTANGSGSSNGNGHANGNGRAAVPAELPPGMTGLWRTRGGPEASGDELAKLNYLYASNWSLWLDVRVLLRTLPKLVDPGGTAVPTGGNGSAPATPPVAPAKRQANGALLESLIARRVGLAASPSTQLTLSVVVPATNRPATLDMCLAAIRDARQGPDEIVVVEDASLRGPAAARNNGADRATGDLLVFVDADVVVHRDVFVRIRKAFEDDAKLIALFGSYDDGVPTVGRVATFRNLLHHHVHQSCAGAASTFWSGLGAVRRDEFLRSGGFDSRTFGVPSVEDIELGMRLSDGGADIRLDPSIQGTHLKDWSLWDMLRTDFLRRGVPWTILLLRRRRAPRTTLNLSWSHRLSAIAALGVPLGIVFRKPWLVLGALASVFGLNGRFYVLLTRRHGVVTGATGLGLHMLHHLVSAAALPVGVLLHGWDRFRRRQS